MGGELNTKIARVRIVQIPVILYIIIGKMYNRVIKLDSIGLWPLSQNFDYGNILK